MFGYDWIMLAIMSGALIIGGVVKGVVGLGRRLSPWGSC